MAAFVQSQGFQVNGVTTFDVTLVGVAAGNLLTVQESVFTDFGDPLNNAPFDSKGNSWAILNEPAAELSTNAFICYAPNCAAEAGGTVVTIDNVSGFGQAAAHGCLTEWSGVITSSPLDKQGENAAVSDSTPDITASGANTQANDLVLAVFAPGSLANPIGIDVPATTGYTNLSVNQNNSSAQAGSTDYKIVSGIETSSAAWGTLDGSFGWTAKIATFKATGGAAGPAVPPNDLQREQPTNSQLFNFEEDALSNEVDIRGWW